jgi:uncharacterized protein with PQ loop repeat
MPKFLILLVVAVCLIIAVMQTLSFGGFDIRLAAAIFIFLLYCCVVQFVNETDEKRRRKPRFPVWIQILIQIVLGIITALSIAFIGKASGDEYAVALGIGLFGGATAHWWTRLMQHL